MNSNVSQTAVRQGPKGSIEVHEGGNTWRRWEPAKIAVFLAREFRHSDCHLHYKDNAKTLQEISEIPGPVLVIVDHLLKITPGIKQGLAEMVLSTTPSGFGAEVAAQNLQRSLERARLL